VIDAALEPKVYLSLAEQHGWQITVVLDTHIHADHLSRTRHLAESCEATLYLPEQNRVTYPFTPLNDGATLQVGVGGVWVVRTPGHWL
jgi:glyoxylase-like metal-dependent hydrolase (beta-lactamase superfamily II)